MVAKPDMVPPETAPALDETPSREPEKTRVQKAIEENEKLLEDKFGGPSFWLCLKKAFTPTIWKDLTQAEDKQRIEEIAFAPQTRELENAQQDLVDTLCSFLFWLNPVYWYLRLQNYMSWKQFTKWRETADDLKREQEHHKWYSWRGLWNFFCSFFNFLRHFRRHPVESTLAIFVIALWVFTLVWALVTSKELEELAFFVGGFGTNARSFILVISIFLHLNANIHVIVRWANKRGITPYAAVQAYGIVAYRPGWRHHYDEEEFKWIVLTAALIWSNSVFFYSEILFIMAVAFAVILVILMMAFFPLSPEQRTELEKKSEKVAEARDPFNELKKKHEAKITPLFRDEFDCLLQIPDGIISLSGIYSKLTGSLLKRACKTVWNIPIRAWEITLSLFSWSSWSWSNVFRVFKNLWRAFKSFLMAGLLLLPKLGFLAITGGFFFIQVYPFLDKPLLYIQKLNWGIQVSIKMLLCLPSWRSVIFMGDQASYLVMATIWQIIGISMATLINPYFLEALKWLVSDSVMQSVMTLWLSELPGDICIWCCARLGLWILRKIEKRSEKSSEDLEINGTSAAMSKKSG